MDWAPAQSLPLVQVLHDVWVICNLLGASLARSACEAGLEPGREQLPALARGDPQRPCRHPPWAGAKAPGDTEEVLGQMSYIKWQVINSR